MAVDALGNAETEEAAEATGVAVGAADPFAPLAPAPTKPCPTAGIARAHRNKQMVEIWADQFRIIKSRGSKLTTVMQASCPHHCLNANTGCKKRVTFKNQDPHSEAQTLRSLRSWCNRASDFN